MGWSKRGNGRQYDSLDVYGAIIGFMSKKVLDFGTRNRKCAACDHGVSKDMHDCRFYFVGSAKAMESDLNTQLVNRSSILAKENLQVRITFGNEDSSTIAAIRRSSSHTVLTFADTNHLKKNFTSDIYLLQSKHKEINAQGVIQHIQLCFAYAITQNCGNISDLVDTLLSIPQQK